MGTRALGLPTLTHVHTPCYCYTATQTLRLRLGSWRKMDTIWLAFLVSFQSFAFTLKFFHIKKKLFVLPIVDNRYQKNPKDKRETCR